MLTATHMLTATRYPAISTSIALSRRLTSDELVKPNHVSLAESTRFKAGFALCSVRKSFNVNQQTSDVYNVDFELIEVEGHLSDIVHKRAAIYKCQLQKSLLLQCAPSSSTLVREIHVIRRRAVL